MGTLSEEHEHRVVAGIPLNFLAYVCLPVLHNVVLTSEPPRDRSSMLKMKMAYVKSYISFTCMREA